jgi:sugar lactone lactonase YvrE
MPLTLASLAGCCALMATVVVASPVAGAAAPPPGTITTIAGVAGNPGVSGVGGPAAASLLMGPQDVAVARNGDVYIGNDGACEVRKITATTGTVSIAAGTGTCGNTGNGGPATTAELNDANGVAIDAAGNLYIADSADNQIRRVAAGSGIISVFAGNGTEGYSGDDGPATAAELSNPWGVTVAANGNVVFADEANSVVRSVAPSGVITTIAGNHTFGYSGDHGLATAAELEAPVNVTYDRAGNLYLSDQNAHVVRMVDPAGTITTFAGTGASGSTGNGGPAAAAELMQPAGVAADPFGDVYIADYQADVVREVTPDGVIHAFAGTGSDTDSGDGGPASAAGVGGPAGIFVDLSGNVWIADFDQDTLREVGAPRHSGAGYWFVASDGGIFSYGSAKFHGSTGSIHLNKPVVGMAPTPDGAGYWFVASDGGIFSFGDAHFYGSTGAIHLNKPVVGMAAAPDGKGYWFVASDGGIFSYGDARFHGSTGSLSLVKPIVGMAATPDGGGYWLVASDGGIFTFGDARFFGSAGGSPLPAPVVGMAATPDGRGYWLVGSDGVVLQYGDAPWLGSPANLHLNAPIVGLAAAPDGQGYWLVGSDGGIFNYGDARFFGSTGALHLNQPIVGMAAGP